MFTNKDLIRDLYLFLIKELKPKKKIILRIRKINDHGSYFYNHRTNKQYITIGKKSPLYFACESLVHEIAHCLQKNKNGSNVYSDHSDHWGKCYAKVYRIYLKWLNQV